MKENLGKKAIDKVTNYKGTITAIAIYDTGEIRYLVESIDNTGRPISNWCDECRLTIIENKEEN